jgi:O-antigen ligase
MRFQLQLYKFFAKLNISFELVLLCLFFITLPLKNSYNSISILLLLLFSLPKFSKENLNDLRNYKIILAYFLFSCISLFYTEDLDKGLNTLLGHCIFLALPLIFINIKFTKEHLKRAHNLFIIWICMLALYSEVFTVYNLLESGKSLSLWFRKDFSYITLGNIIGIHPPYMSLFTSYSILVLIDKIGHNKLKNVGYSFVVIFLLFYTIHLSSRLPIVALLLVSSMFILKKLSLHNSFAKTSFKILILMGIIFTLLFSVRSTRYRFIEVFGMQYTSGLYIKSGPAKLDQWTAAFYANNNKLFGNGIGDVNNSVTESNMKHGLIRNADRKYNAHNQYIQTYVGLGLVGLVLLLGFLFYCWNFNKPLLNPYNYYLIYLVIVLFSESYLQRHQGIVFIAFLFCLIQFTKTQPTSLAND